MPVSRTSRLLPDEGYRVMVYGSCVPSLQLPESHWRSQTLATGPSLPTPPEGKVQSVSST